MSVKQQNNKNPFKSSFKISKIIIDTKFKNVDAISEFLEGFELTVSSFEFDETTHVEPLPEDRWHIEAYLNDTDDGNEIIQAVENYIKNLNIIAEVVALEEVPDTDWVAEIQKNIPIFKLFPFIVSSPEKIKDNKKFNIKIAAGRAFGTGGHETTASCIEAIDLILRHNNIKKVIDVGTGSGILAISAKKLNQNLDIMATDLDEVAVEVAKENAKINHADDIKFIVSNGFKNDEITENGKYDLIIANILAKPLKIISHDLRKNLKPGGYVILSGFLRNQVSFVFNSYKLLGFKIHKKIYHNHWVCLILKG